MQDPKVAPKISPLLRFLKIFAVIFLGIPVALYIVVIFLGKVFS
jgi:hypothetical protein